jgi:hypothetical protein
VLTGQIDLAVITRSVKTAENIQEISKNDCSDSEKADKRRI